MGYLAVWLGSTFLKVWGSTIAVGLLCLCWSVLARQSTLKQARRLSEMVTTESSTTEEAEPNFVEDWRSLQQKVSDESGPALLGQYQGAAQLRVLVIVLVTSIAAAIGLDLMTLTRLSRGLAGTLGEGMIEKAQFDSVILQYEQIYTVFLELTKSILLMLPGYWFIVANRWIDLPVAKRLGKLTWGKREYLSSVLWETAGTFSLSSCLITIFSLFNEAEYFETSAIFFTIPTLLILGLSSLVFCRGQAAIQVKEVPLPLLSGELRDRVLQIGQRAGVKIPRVLIMPTTGRAMANGFAHADGTVSLTDYLVTQSCRAEIDAVIAHEIAHLKYHHARWMVCVPVSSGVILLLNIAFWHRLEIYFLVFLFSTWIAPRIYRRFEYAADALSGKLTGQPEKMIAALARLEQLNPLRQPGNKETTHPTMLKRFEAIAKAHNLSDETVRQQLLQASEPIDPSEAYPIPLGSDDKIFPTSQKQKYQQRELFLLLSASLVPLAAIAALSPYLPSQSLQIAFAGVGLLVVVGACYWSDRHSSFNLPKPVLQRLRQQLAQTAGPSAIVSLSPDGQPQIYGSSWFWDLGVLSLKDGQLHYRGGQTEFCLSPDQVNNLHLAADVPSLVRAPNLYLTWNNAEQGKTNADSHGDLRLRFLDLPSRQAVRQVTRDWRDRLETWRQQPVESTPQPSDSKTLDGDSFVTALANPRSYRQLLSNLLSLWLLGAVGALMLVGLLELTSASWFYISVGPALVAA